MLKIGFYSGSFDPFTNGHLHIVKTASHIFDKVIIGIGINYRKMRRYDSMLMKSAIETTLKNEHIENVEVITYDTLTVDIAKKYNASFLIRGLRNDTDYAYEENLSQINEEISGLDTIYLRSSNLNFISSSMVNELIEYKKDVSKYLPKDILNIINNIERR